MKHPSAILMTTALLFCGGFAHAGTPQLMEGTWKFDINYDLIDIPQTFPGYTLTQCMSKDSPVPSINRPGNECQTTLEGSFGNTYTWTLDCTDDWEIVQGMGRIHYRGDQAEGDIHLQITNPHNPPQMMEFQFKGQRKGRCDT